MKRTIYVDILNDLDDLVGEPHDADTSKSYP